MNEKNKRRYSAGLEHLHLRIKPEIIAWLKAQPGGAGHTIETMVSDVMDNEQKDMLEQRKNNVTFNVTDTQ